MACTIQATTTIHRSTMTTNTSSSSVSASDGVSACAGPTTTSSSLPRCPIHATCCKTGATSSSRTVPVTTSTSASRWHVPLPTTSSSRAAVPNSSLPSHSPHPGRSSTARTMPTWPLSRRTTPMPTAIARSSRRNTAGLSITSGSSSHAPSPPSPVARSASCS